MRTTLYRAAERDGGYFGRGSYWTPSRRFAGRFGLWAEHEQKVIERVDLVVWSLDIDEPDDAVLDLRGPGFLLTLSSEKINAKVESLASKYRWVFFHEGAFEGTVSTQAVYLGTDFLRPVAVR